MSLYFDLIVNQTKAATVSVRKIHPGVYGYEVIEKSKSRRGTVEYDGDEELSLITTVLNDLPQGTGNPQRKSHAETST